MTNYKLSEEDLYKLLPIAAQDIGLENLILVSLSLLDKSEEELTNIRENVLKGAKDMEEVRERYVNELRRLMGC